MVFSLLYFLLAILSLSFLIFIHELGHYYMARRLGMRVEVFSIGFGKALYSWTVSGVKWQIGWLPFGGYVKIAGMEGEIETDPYMMKDGFFGKRPLDRIKVAFMGPCANIVFALLLFAFLWALGGREKKFGDYTKKIGWLDPKSELYAHGVRPGDEITAYNEVSLNSAKEHLMAPMLSSGDLLVEGYKVDDYTKEKTPFKYLLKTYPHPNSIEKEILTVGVMHPASYVIYDPQSEDIASLEGSPMRNSGIKPGDRIVWVDGISIHSLQEVLHVLNDSKVLLTIRRGDDLLTRRVPRVPVEELRVEGEFKEELIDWQFEAQLNTIKIQKLFALPYNLNNEGVVEGQLRFIDREKEEEIFPLQPFSNLETPLEKGDKILAVDGIPVTYSYQILAGIQQRRIQVVVERNANHQKVPSWKDADELFDHQYPWSDLKKLTAQIGLPIDRDHIGNLYLLEPIIPKTRRELRMALGGQDQTHVMEVYEKELQEIEDPEKKAQVLQMIQDREQQFLLGLPAIQDQKVRYNPEPLVLFQNLIEEIGQTLKALFTGTLSPKWMAGPIGMVQVMHDNSMSSVKEGIYWLGAISLNLGILNLLPLPVLDGGTICFSFYEMVSGRRLKLKTLEKLIIPFAVLLVCLFLFLTYNDVLRMFKNFF